MSISVLNAMSRWHYILKQLEETRLTDDEREKLERAEEEAYEAYRDAHLNWLLDRTSDFIERATDAL